MKVIAHLIGGPHDGAEREIAAPFPMVMTVFLNGVLADYHYHGFKDGSAFYNIEPVGALHASAA